MFSRKILSNGADAETGVVLILSQFPDEDSAEVFARVVLEKRLAACVTCSNKVTSLFSWNGQVERVEEVSVSIKTQAKHYDEVEEQLFKHHPYEVPEILVLPVLAGLDSYVNWVKNETN